nr:MAG TPA: hypothetical protein [Caudoviricetes sp.]
MKSIIGQSLLEFVMFLMIMHFVLIMSLANISDNTTPRAKKTLNLVKR